MYKRSDSKMFSRAELAHYLRISPVTLKKWESKGYLKSDEVRDKRKLYKVETVNRFMKRNEI